MSEFIPWDSQPLARWAGKYAQGETVDLGGYITHYLEYGAGEPVILLHGFFYDSYLWTDNVAALADKFKVYALDLWGFGYSTRAALDYGYQLYADQLLLFMDYLGLHRASLVGQSMAGGIAMLFGVQHRARVNKLVLVGPAGIPLPMPLTARILKLPYVGEFLFGVNSNFFRKKNLADFWIYNKDLITETYVENVARSHKVKGSTAVMMYILRKNFFGTLSDQVQQLGQQDIPILLVTGQQDKMIPLPIEQQLHRMLPGAQFEIIAEAGHAPNYEQADQFNQIVLDFL